MNTVRNRNHRTANMPFNPFFLGNQPNRRMTPNAAPTAKILTNIIRTENGFDIELAAPGFQKEDFKIDIEKDQLKVSFTKKETEDEVTYVKQEFAVGSFTKTFNLPTDIDLEKISASYQLGILSISLEKKEKIVKTIAIK